MPMSAATDWVRRTEYPARWDLYDGAALVATVCHGPLQRDWFAQTFERGAGLAFFRGFRTLEAGERWCEMELAFAGLEAIR